MSAYFQWRGCSYDPNPCGKPQIRIPSASGRWTFFRSDWDGSWWKIDETMRCRPNRQVGAERNLPKYVLKKLRRIEPFSAPFGPGWSTVYDEDNIAHETAKLFRLVTIKDHRIISRNR